jgi:hypothetical protein
VRRLAQKAADFGVTTIDLGSVLADAIKDMRLEILREEFG